MQLIVLVEGIIQSFGESFNDWNESVLIIIEDKISSEWNKKFAIERIDFYLRIIFGFIFNSSNGVLLPHVWLYSIR